MTVSSITKAWGYTDQKGNYIKVWSNWKPVASQTVSNTDSFPVDNRLVLNDWTSYWSAWTPRSWSKTTTSFDSSWNQVWQTTQNYWGWWSAQRSSAVTPVTPAYSPLVKSTVQPTWALRNADWNYSLDTQWYEENEKKRKQALGITEITKQVQPNIEWSPKKFNQWEYVDNAKQAIDMLQNKSLETEWAVGGEERMARQRQEAADKAIQDELQWLNRAWQLFDRQNENLLQSKDRTAEQTSLDVERAKEDRKFQLDEYRKNTTRNIEDTAKQRDDTMQSIRRQSAALWLNVTSTYNQSYKTTLDKFNNVINRMSEDLNTQEWRSALEDKRLDADYTRATKQLLQDYERESTRLKQDFEFATRDYRENLILDANKLVEQYGLSSDKLWARLQELSLWAFNAVNEAYWSFLDNTQKQTDILDSQVNNVLDTRNKYLAQQKTYADNFLAWSQNMTISDLNAMVRDGQISEQLAQQTLWQVVQMALDTIDTATADWVWVQFQDEIIDAINNGMTPMQAIQQVMQSEEFAPVVTKMQEMWLTSYQKALAQLQIQQGRLWLQQSQQEIQQWNLDYQTQLKDFVTANGATGDLRWLASQFPWQARAKNNNPAGITWNNNFATGKWTAALLDQAGIPYEIWTPRPSAEWWNYVSFPTIEDGLAAQRILMTQTYWNNTVQQMLGKWVWTWEALNYAKQVAWNAWVPLNVTVNQLNDQQVQALQMAKIKKESPGLFKLLSQQSSTWWAPTPSEQAMFNKWAQYIGKEWGLSQARYNEIANYNTANKDTSTQESPYFKAFNMLSFAKPTLAEQEQVKIEWMIKSGDVKWAKTKLEWLAKEWLDTAARNDYDATRTIVSSLDKVQKTLDALNAKWVKTSLLKGKYEDLVNKFWKQSDPEIAKLWVTLKDQLDAIRRARSWAALTEFEEAFYDSIFPSNQSNYDLNTSKIAWFKDSRKMLFDTYLEQAYGTDLVQEIWNNAWWSTKQAPANNNVNRINQLRVSVPLANSPLSSKFD